MRKYILFITLLTSGCIGLGVDDLYVQNGVQVYRARCNGMARDIGDCMALASEKCNGNFQVLSSQEQDMGNINNTIGGANISGNSNSNYRTNVYNQGNQAAAYTRGNTSYNTNVAASSTSFNGKIINRQIFFFCPDDAAN